MKKIDFSQNGGFPLKQDTLAFMQNSYSELQEAVVKWFTAPGKLAQVFPAFIFTGLEVIVEGGQQMLTPGWIIRNGMLLYFPGSTLHQAQDEGIGIQTVKTSALFKDGLTREVYEEKIAVAGGVDPIYFEQFTRIANINDLRPVLARKITRNLTVLTPGAYRTIDIDVIGAEEGDVVVISLSDVTDDNNAISAAHGAPEFVTVRGKVNVNDKVSVFLMNNHPSLSAFGGDIVFRIRILK